MASSPAWKHHCLWGGVVLFLVALGIVTREFVAYFWLGFGDLTDRILIMGIGEGALFLGLPDDGGGWGLEIDIEDDVLDSFAWMPGMVEAVPYIPLWWILLVPVIFWVLAIYRLRHRKRAG